MSQGITRKLILYFILVILSFAIIGIVFGFNVRKQTRESIEVSLLSQSTLIANVIAENRTFDIEESVVNTTFQVSMLRIYKFGL